MKSKTGSKKEWKAEYIWSYVDPNKLPDDTLAQVAIIGRSNVGKSSFINSLCNQKGLARISASPGKTQTLNFYKVNNAFYLVDMPGYGFAKVSKSLRSNWSEFSNSYFKASENLVCVLILSDANIPPQSIDLEFINWCGEQGIPIKIIRTKIDKSKTREIEELESQFVTVLSETWEEIPTIKRHSSVKHIGNEEIRSLVESMCDRN